MNYILDRVLKNAHCVSRNATVVLSLMLAHCLFITTEISSAQTLRGSALMTLTSYSDHKGRGVNEAIKDGLVSLEEKIKFRIKLNKRNRKKGAFTDSMYVNLAWAPEPAACRVRKKKINCDIDYYGDFGEVETFSISFTLINKKKNLYEVKLSSSVDCDGTTGCQGFNTEERTGRVKIKQR